MFKIFQGAERQTKTAPELCSREIGIVFLISDDTESRQGGNLYLFCSLFRGHRIHDSTDLVVVLSLVLLEEPSAVEHCDLALHRDIRSLHNAGLQLWNVKSCTRTVLGFVEESMLSPFLLCCDIYSIHVFHRQARLRESSLSDGQVRHCAEGWCLCWSRWVKKVEEGKLEKSINYGGANVT